MNRQLLYSASVVIGYLIIQTLVKNKNKRKIWSRSWLQRRQEGKGLLHMLNEELKVEDINSYNNFLRMNSSQFEELLKIVSNNISKKDTFMRASISARNKLEITLRYLATGETFRSAMYNTRIHETTISRFVPEVCQAIINNLKEKYLKTPDTPEQWNKIAEDFQELWQFPLCLGALDGKHITFSAPISAGSYYYNYKGTHSIVLLGLCDARYKFTYVNVGVNGRVSDGGVFSQSHLAKAIAENTLNFPTPKYLPGQQYKVPYVIVADDAFALTNRLMKPYAERGLSDDQKIFNYRLSRARRCIENTFGILANRFRVLLNPIRLSVQKVELITMTCVILHNYLIATSSNNDYGDISNYQHNQGLQGVGRQGGNRNATTAKQIRDYFKDYFNSPNGSVDWQSEAIREFNY